MEHLHSFDNYNLQSVTIIENFGELTALLAQDYFDCTAGFPSPADDYSVERLDLTTHLIKHPDATYFVRVRGDSMKDAGINSGDILIVDRAIEPTNDRIIIACLNGDLIVKRIHSIDNEICLLSENPCYQPIFVTPALDFEI